MCVAALRRNRGPGCATCSPSQIDVVLYSGSHRVGVYLYCTGAIPVEERGHSPPLFFIGGSGCDWDCVLSLPVAGHPEESITLLRLMVVASVYFCVIRRNVNSEPCTRTPVTVLPERIPSTRHSRVTRVTLRSLKFRVSPATSFTGDVC